MFYKTLSYKIPQSATALVTLYVLLCNLIIPFTTVYGRLSDNNISFIKENTKETSKNGNIAITQKPVSEEKMKNALGNIPLSFEINHGQVDKRVKFLSRGKGYTLFLTKNESVLSLKKPTQENSDDKIFAVSKPAKKQAVETQTALRTKFVGANLNPRVEGLEPLAAKTNYFTGDDQKNWRTNVEQFAKVKYSQVYRGIDVIYYGKGQELEYDFVVAPGADPRKIKMQFKGADKIKVDGNGDLVLRTKLGDVRHQKPFIYQEVNGERRQINGRYIMFSKKRVGFKIDSYDLKTPLVIDPVIVYSTFVSHENSGGPQANGIAVHEDNAGDVYVYVTGVTGNDFHTTASAYQTQLNGGDNPDGHDAIIADAFIAKFKMEIKGQATLKFLTYFGGSYGEVAQDIALDSEGNAYITGWTTSSNLPLLKNLENSSNPYSDCLPFVAMFSSDGASLGYSTYLGIGSQVDWGRRGCFSPNMGYGIAVDLHDNAYITGHTISPNFPVTANAFQPTKPSGPNPSRVASAFLAKIAPPAETGGVSLAYSTYLGGSVTIPFSGVLGNFGRSIAVDSTGNAYISGITHSGNFPLKNPFQSTNYPGETVFVSKINTLASGNDSLVYSTYLGGSSFEFDNGIAIDSAGYIYVTGSTRSSDFPTTEGAFQRNYEGEGDAFVTKLNPFNDGNPQVVYSTYLGGKSFETHGGGGEGANGIAVDPAGNAYIMGVTNSIDFPTKNPLQSASGGVMQSLNRGDEWTALNNGLLKSDHQGFEQFFTGDIRGLALDTSKTPRTLYAATTRGVFKSQDGGLNWNDISRASLQDGLTNLNAWKIINTPSSPNTIYVTSDDGVFRTSDGGGSWQKVNEISGGLGSLSNVTHWTVDKSSTPATVFAATDTQELYKLTDGSNLWQPTGLNKEVYGIISVPNAGAGNADTLYVASSEGLFKSTDRGVNWMFVNGDGTIPGALGFDISGSQFTLFAVDMSTYDGLKKSTDGGTTWTLVSNPNFLRDELENYCFCDTVILSDNSTSPSTVYVSSPFTVIHRSTDGGETWSPVTKHYGGALVLDRDTGASPFPVYGVTRTSRDIFVTKLNASGSEILFSTYLGGELDDMGFALALDSSNNIYVTGYTDSPDFPLLNPYQQNHGGSRAVFLTKLGNVTLPASSTETVTTEVIVQSGTLEVALPNIQDTDTTDNISPTISVEPIDSGTTENLTVSNNLGAYEIKVNNATVDTTGYFNTGCTTDGNAVPCWEKHGIKIGFTVPTVNDVAVFNNLVISHGEDTDNNPNTPLVLVPYDEAQGSARHTYKDFANRKIWVYVPSLSPFIILKGAKDQLTDLTKLVHSFNLQQGIENSLNAKLQNAINAYQAVNSNNRTTACNIMGSFVSQVQAQSGNHITQVQAGQLLTSARQIRVVLGCS